MTEYRMQWKVQGSAAEPYTVSVTVDGFWSCSCVGWTRHMPRRDCKHIKEKKAKFPEYLSATESPPKTIQRAHVDSGDSAPTAKSLVKAGASQEEAADAARVKREEVSAKKDAKLGRLRYKFQLALTYEPTDLSTSKWVAEIKYDGILAMWVDGRFINRSGNDVTHRFPEIRPTTNAVLVGELVVLDANDMSQFNKIQERNTDDPIKIGIGAKSNPATFIAFDVLEIDGQDITSLSLEGRYDHLQTLGKLGERVKTVEQIPISSDREVQILVDKCRELETEGIMLKNLAARYVGKRGRNWIKCKTWTEIELPVLRYEDTGIGDGFVIYVQLNSGREQRVVVNGFKDREALKVGLAAGKVVAEIKFLSESKGALRFPSFRRLTEANGRRLVP